MEALRAGEAIMLEKQKVERRRDPPSLKDEAQQSIRWISGLGWAGWEKSGRLKGCLSWPG